MSTDGQISAAEARALDDKHLLLERRANYSVRDNPADADRIATAVEKTRDIYAERQTSPPNVLVGEDSRSFRLRQIGELRGDSEQWAEVGLRALASLDQGAFDAAEAQIIADARAAARTWAPEGQLRERKIQKSPGGPTISEFSGDPKVWLSAFMSPGRALRNFVYPGSNGVPIEHRRITVDLK
jgi:hypothetical protein